MNIMSEPGEYSVPTGHEHLEEQIAALNERVDDLQYQVFQLGNALVQSLTYSANVAASIGAADELRDQTARRAQELLQQIEATLDKLPWSEIERPRLG